MCAAELHGNSARLSAVTTMLLRRIAIDCINPDNTTTDQQHGNDRLFSEHFRKTQAVQTYNYPTPETEDE